MATLLAQSEPAQTDHVHCWQPLVEVSGGEYLGSHWSGAATAFCGTWHESSFATPHKPRGKPWEVDTERAPTPTSAEKCCREKLLTHGSGMCQPCAWYWKPVGCSKGQDCVYCHLCPEGELKTRRKKKMAALRFGAPAIFEKTGDVVELVDDNLASTEPANATEVLMAQPVLPIQLESLLPEAPASDYTLVATAATTCTFPSLPRSAPPCNPPSIQNFDVTPPPPPLQDLSACDPWQWQQDASLTWSPQCSPWTGYPQHLSLEAEIGVWHADSEFAVPLVQEECPVPPPQMPVDPRSSPPKVLEDGVSLLRFASGQQSAEARVLIVIRRGMLDAYEVLSEDWDACPSEPRVRSCPAELRNRMGSEVALPRSHEQHGQGAVRSPAMGAGSPAQIQEETLFSPTSRCGLPVDWRSGATRLERPRLPDTF